MKRLLFIVAAFCLYTLSINHAQAQGVGAYMSYATFNIPGETPYLEVHLEILGNTLKYKRLPSGSYQGSIQVTMIAKQGDEIKDFKKYDLFSPEVPDTSSVGINFIDQQRFTIPNGEYTLDLSIADNNSDVKPSTISYPVTIEFPADKPSVSTVQLVNSYNKTTDHNILSKSGYDLVPMVDNYFVPEKEKVIFYSEIYNPLYKEGSDEKYVVTYHIESFENRRVLNDFARTKVEPSRPVIVALSEFNIAKLPTGNYNLVVSLKDKNNKEIASNTTFFQRANPAADKKTFDYSNVDLSNSFASAITSSDTLREYIKSLSPISTELERMFIKFQVNEAPLTVLQQYFQRFWEQRSESNPKDAWEKYKVQVKRVNAAYGTQVKRGYDTDMGYVFLKYGEPDVIQDIPFEVSALDKEPSVPYQIWQYYSLFGGRERNKRFVFVNSEIGAKDYTLVHSDVTGEISNYSWPSALHRRVTAGDIDKDRFEKIDSRATKRYSNPF